MSFVRPEIVAGLTRWREPLLALGFAALGVWLALRGGAFYGTLGSLAVGVGLGLALSAWRRMRFAGDGRALDPGVVQIDEGAIAYFGPETGGVVALSDLVLVEAAALDGVRLWRLRQEDGRTVAIPMAAKGAERLFDVFGALPGARIEVFLAARDGAPPRAPRTLWRRASAQRDPALPKA